MENGSNWRPGKKKGFFSVIIAQQQFVSNILFIYILKKHAIMCRELQARTKAK
jgi:hypothetical protein